MGRKRRHYDKYSIPPLHIQFDSGYAAFKTKDQWLKKTKKGKTIIVTANPYPHYTMQAREWQRGYDTAYFENLNDKVRTRG